MSVWSDLIGQQPAVEVLSKAAVAERVGHAWLVVGPPGSGRSNAARAFAAALQCRRGGCGTCDDCRTSLAGSHPDITLVATETLSIGIRDSRELTVRAAMSPVLGRYQVLVVEDADRLTEQAADALLKSVEEPAPRSVWMLCAPTTDDVPVTIRSRCRVVTLRTPPEADVADALRTRFGADERLARFAARASQGHIGRAKALATDEGVRARLQDVLALPTAVARADLAGCLAAADSLVKAAAAESAAVSAEADQAEKDRLRDSLGLGEEKSTSRHVRAALRELQDRQKSRARRLQRDALDRALLDLSAFYRDVLLVGLGAGAELVNEQMRDEVEALAEQVGPAAALRCEDAITACRERLAGNVAPLIAMEALMVDLHTAG